MPEVLAELVLQIYNVAGCDSIRISEQFLDQMCISPLEVLLISLDGPRVHADPILLSTASLR